MKILVFGNSHAGALKLGFSLYESSRESQINSLDVDWAALPRPSFNKFYIADNRICGLANKTFRLNSRSLQTKLANEHNLLCYDKILLCFSSNRLWLNDYFGSHILSGVANLTPKHFVCRLISTTLAKAIISNPRETISCQGILDILLNQFRAKIIFIGMPQRGKSHPSAQRLIASLSECEISIMSNCLERVRQSIQASAGVINGLNVVLPPTHTLDSNQFFTKDEFMKADHVHAKAEYGLALWEEMDANGWLRYV